MLWLMSLCTTSRVMSSGSDPFPLPAISQEVVRQLMCLMTLTIATNRHADGQKQQEMCKVKRQIPNKKIYCSIIQKKTQCCTSRTDLQHMPAVHSPSLPGDSPVHSYRTVWQSRKNQPHTRQNATPKYQILHDHQLHILPSNPFSWRNHRLSFQVDNMCCVTAFARFREAW